MVFYIKISGVTSFISYSSNLYSVCDNCLRWFLPDIIVSIYTYPDPVLLATIYSGKISFHRMGVCP